MGDTAASSKVQLPYLAGLDGVRAISVLAVFFYHAGFPWAVGGFLGVESFFVISGYLITSLLLREYLADHHLALGRFWLRRARRLLPALWLVLAAVLFMAWQWVPDSLPRLREDVPAAFLYVTNWVFVFREVPYFEQFARPPLLQHLWSLAVEEQFYLIWPLALWFVLRMLRVRNMRQVPWLVIPIMLGVAASSARMATLYDPLGDPSRVYYGTDTRAAGFLLGAGLAAFWEAGRRAGRKTWMVEAAGICGLMGLMWLFANLNEYETFLYRGGFVVTALLTCLVLLAASCSETHLGKLLGCLPLRWIGTRSYGIYLWHWPLMAVTSWGGGSALPHIAVTALQLGATFLLAELSYRWVEQPVRQHGFRVCCLASSKPLGRFRMNTAALGGLIILVGCIAVQPASGAPAQASAEIAGSRAGVGSSPIPPSQVHSAGLGISAPSATPPVFPPSRTHRPSEIRDSSAKALASATPAPSSATVPMEPASSSQASSSFRLTLIGDSVMESVGPWLDREFARGTFYLEAARKRRTEDMLTLIPKLAADGHLADTVIIHLGTNVPFEDAVFDDVMRSLLEHGVTRVLFLTVRRPVAWEWTVNHRLAEGVERWPQAELVDWHQLSESQPGWFIDDGVHPTYTGAEAYVDLVRQALGESDQGNPSRCGDCEVGGP